VSVRLSRRDTFVYDHIWRNTDSETLSDSFSSIVQILSERNKRPAKVGDLGCGVGRHTLHAASAGHSVEAIDHHPRAIEVLRQRAVGLPVTVWHEDLVDWIPKQLVGSYDAIVCFDALHHISPEIQQISSLLKSIKHLLAPEGHLLITMLCDINYSTGERISSRLQLNSSEGEDLLDSAFEGFVLKKAKRKPFEVKSTVSYDGSSSLRVADYSATRILRWYHRPSIL
jgi:2-polyprenyl-3-methyl-5-hydroxy-6-metoxy-1,4-benzoquinol methylase